MASIGLKKLLFIWKTRDKEADKGKERFQIHGFILESPATAWLGQEETRGWELNLNLPCVTVTQLYGPSFSASQGA